MIEILVFAFLSFMTILGALFICYGHDSKKNSFKIVGFILIFASTGAIPLVADFYKLDSSIKVQKYHSGRWMSEEVFCHFYGGEIVNCETVIYTEQL